MAFSSNLIMAEFGIYYQVDASLLTPSISSHQISLSHHLELQVCGLTHHQIPPFQSFLLQRS
jgi:hypothetical protein